MRTGREDRFWLLVADEEINTHIPGWWGVVDEEAGGIIAYAATQNTAEIIRRAFIRRAGPVLPEELGW